MRGEAGLERVQVRCFLDQIVGGARWEDRRPAVVVLGDASRCAGLVRLYVCQKHLLEKCRCTSAGIRLVPVDGRADALNLYRRQADVAVADLAAAKVEVVGREAVEIGRVGRLAESTGGEGRWAATSPERHNIPVCRDQAIARTTDANGPDDSNFFRGSGRQCVLGYLSPCQVGEIAGRKAEVVRKNGLELRLEIG